MTSDNTLPMYEKISSLTSQMLAAAQEKKWDQLSELEMICAQHVAQLQSHAPAIELSEPLRSQKVRILEKILDDDRAIRNLTAPWMLELQHMLQSTGNQQRLHHAYSGHNPH